MTRCYKAHFGKEGPVSWMRFVVFHHDGVDPLPHDFLISDAGNKISDLLIAEGEDPLLYRYGDPQQITELEYVVHSAEAVS